jgi:hypothetical protein
MSAELNDYDQAEILQKEAQIRERKRSFVTPECCQKVQDEAGICLKATESFWKGDIETPPQWIVRVAGYWVNSNSFGCTEAAFCPFCATPVPPIEKRQTDQKITKVTDGGYYCDSCKKRCNCCTCLPAEFYWQAVGAKTEIPLPDPEDEEDEED